MNCKYAFRLLPLLLALSCTTYAESSFDLAGPKVEVSVSRAGKPLPISQTPALESGDKLWIHPVFPSNESVHYLLIVAFLRGATNPPPENWFTKAETWKKQVRQEGITVTVPDQAQQALIFLAPQTGGDFDTLRSAVQGKPGAFVRAAQDLNLASSDRLRVEAYLSAIHEISSKDPKSLHDRSSTLARSLNLKLDSQCFDKPTEQQAPCLTQNTDQIILDDGHGQSMLATLSSGPEVDLVGAVSATKPGGNGAFSPYVGVIVDIAHVLQSLHTAQYQYIPALAVPHNEQLSLRLNNAPSYHKPISVIVIALPPVHHATPPVLRPLDTKQVLCAQKQPGLVFPIESAPWVFSSNLGHDFSLHIQNQAGKSLDIAVHPDPTMGGFVPDKAISMPADLGSNISATLHGRWGFQSFDGPAFELRNAPAAAEWKLTHESEASLVMGRESTFHIHSDVAACVEQISIEDAHHAELKTSWKFESPDDLEVKTLLPESAADTVTMQVKQFGLKQAVHVPLKTYAESGKIEQFLLHAGDQKGVLKGTRLDQVAGVEVAGMRFVPSSMSRVQKQDELSLLANAPASPALHPEEAIVAHVALKDGRMLQVNSKVEAPRPAVTLIAKKIRTNGSAVRLGNGDDLPTDGTLTFFVRSQVPSTFSRTQKIEVGSVDGSFSTSLSISNGAVSLQDAQTAVVVLNPSKSFGSSAFGALQFRPVAEDGTAGDWQPLVRLVRVPNLKEVHCPDNPDAQCTLYGEQLFLIDSVSAEPNFSAPVSVPSDSADESVSVPRPRGTLMYLKLRDDPGSINTAVLPVLPESK